MINIRKAKKEDLPQLEKLFIDFVLEISRLDFYKKKPEVVKKTTKKFIYGRFKNKNTLLLVAEDKNQLVGFASGHIKTEKAIYQIKKEGFVNDLYIKKNFRKMGVGQKLMKVMLKIFKAKNASTCSLTVLGCNQPALKLYDKLGFFENRKIMVKRL